MHWQAYEDCPLLCKPRLVLLHNSLQQSADFLTSLTVDTRESHRETCSLTPFDPNPVCLSAGWLNILYALIFGMLFSRTCVVIFWTLAATLLLPAKPVLWNAVLCSPIFATWRRYFNFSYLQEAPLDPSKHYILAQFPHAVFPLSQLVGGTAAESQCPDWKIFTLAADSVFYVPLWKQFVAWLGAVPANSRSFKDALSRGSVSVIVGGIAGGCELFEGGGRVLQHVGRGAGEH